MILWSGSWFDDFVISAFLIEEDSDLQQLASISNHLIHNIACFFNCEDDVDEMTEQGLKEVAIL